MYVNKKTGCLVLSLTAQKSPAWYNLLQAKPGNVVCFDECFSSRATIASIRCYACLQRNFRFIAASVRRLMLSAHRMCSLEF